LTLDFGDERGKARYWYDALCLMTMPWVDIAAVSESHLGKRLLDSGLIQPLAPSPHVDSSGSRLELQCPEAGDTAQLGVQQANETFTGVTEWVETVMSVAGFTQPVLEDVLGQLPVVGAGFQAVSLCLSAVSTLCDALADGRHVAEVTSEIHYLGSHAVVEMMSAAKLSPDDGEQILRSW
jgi:hypothetical protein